MEISINTRQAYSEIDEFLELLSDEQRNEIPQKLREFFKREKDLNYKKGINSEIPIKDQGLKEETLAIIALLNLNYWCKDEEEKERLQRIYLENERKYQEKLQETFNPDNIFKKRKASVEIENEETKNIQMTEYKEPFWRKIINMMLKFIHGGRG